MSGFLSRLGSRLDTWGGATKMQAFKSGWPASTSSDVRFHRSPKVQYRYRERGAGPTIVFAADPPATLELYDELMEIFSQAYRVIVVELPAMGFSAADTSYRFGWRETNDDLTHFLADVAGKDCILAFPCVSGLAAVDIAVRRPELVSRLVLLQSGDVQSFVTWKAGRDPKGVLARPFFGQYVMKAMAPKRMPQWYKLAVGNKQKIDTFCRCASESFEHGALWSLASAYQIYMDPDVTLGTPDQPILAIWGLADGSHPPENAERAKRLSDNVTYVAIPESGHFLELEDPHRIFELVRDFCIAAA